MTTSVCLSTLKTRVDASAFHVVNPNPEQGHVPFLDWQPSNLVTGRHDPHLSLNIAQEGVDTYSLTETFGYYGTGGSMVCRRWTITKGEQ